MEVHFGDVSQAYGQADWPSGAKKVLSHLPLGYQRTHNGRRHCAEVGNLYGHPIAGRNWWTTLRRRLIERGYVQSEWDPCMFTLTRGSEMIWILVYVDDIITFTTRGSTLRPEFAAWFGENFVWTDFGAGAHEFTSIRITRTADSVQLDMERYTRKMNE